MIEGFNAVVGGVVGGLTRPWASLSPWVALGIYAVASDQRALKRSKDRLLARLLEIRLFRDDPVSVLVAFGHVSVCTVRYLAHSLRALVILVPLVLLWIVHLAGWFEWRPIDPGETALVTARLRPGTAPTSAPASLEAPDGFAIDTPALRSLAENELVWRVRALRPGRGTLRVAFGGALVEKGIAAGPGLVPVTPARVSGGLWHRLAWPGEPALGAGGPMAEVRVHYPGRSLSVGGCPVHWLVILFLASIGFGLALKRPLGIEF